MEKKPNRRFVSHLSPLSRDAPKAHRLVRARILRVWRGMTPGHAVKSSKRAHSITYLVKTHLDPVLTDFVKMHLPLNEKGKSRPLSKRVVKDIQITREHLRNEVKYFIPAKLAFRSVHGEDDKYDFDLAIDIANDLLDLVNYLADKALSFNAKKPAKALLYCNLCERPTEYTLSKLEVFELRLEGKNFPVTMIPHQKTIRELYAVEKQDQPKKSFKLTLCYQHNQKHDGNTYSKAKKSTKNFENDVQALGRYFSHRFNGLIPDEITLRRITSGIIRKPDEHELSKPFRTTLFENEPYRVAFLKNVFDDFDLKSLFKDSGLAKICFRDLGRETQVLVQAIKIEGDLKARLVSKKSSIHHKAYVPAVMAKLSKMLNIDFQKHRRSMMNIEALGLQIIFSPEGKGKIFKPKFLDILVASRHFFTVLPTKDELQVSSGGDGSS